MPGNDFSAPVAPTNLRRPPRPAAPRRDPDEDTPTPTPAPPSEPPPAAPEPPADTEPGDERPKPGHPGPTNPHPSRAVAHTDTTADGGTLASVLTAPNHAPGGHHIPQGVAALAGLAAMRRRPVDPMRDWAGDGTRTPRWLSQAIRQYAILTGRETQEVQRDALLGTDRIPDDILDANWLDCYGFPRDQYDPQAYRR